MRAVLLRSLLRIHQQRPNHLVSLFPRLVFTVPFSAAGRNLSSSTQSVAVQGNSSPERVEREEGGGVSYSSLSKRKSGKAKETYSCNSCGARFTQWWGLCPQCGSDNMMKLVDLVTNPARGTDVSEAVLRAWLPRSQLESRPQSLFSVNEGREDADWRIPLAGLFGMEVAAVLGGGLVPGSLTLVGGDPGVGKSTLLLQIAAIIAEGCSDNKSRSVVYVSGEESVQQIGSRAHRMRISTKNLYLYSSTDIEDILDKIQPLSPVALIVDSIQTVYLKGVAGSAGNVLQVKECTSALLRFAKHTNIPVILIGHVTKAGEIAGPRLLEHIVDTVLYLEGERYSSYRLLRSVKNRFGSTDELGVFEMLPSGLQAVSNPSKIFMMDQDSDSEILAGVAVAVAVDGSRAFLVEIQALCVNDGVTSSRYFAGIESVRAHMIISVLMKQAGLKLQNYTVHLNVVSGLKLMETASDLAVAAAICSSLFDFPIPRSTAFIGEIGLAGELRSVPRVDKRVMTVAKLGYKRCVIPDVAKHLITPLDLGIELLCCRSLKEFISVVFRPDWYTS